MKISRIIAAVLLSVAAASQASDFASLAQKMKEIAAQADLRGADVEVAAPRVGRSVVVQIAAPAPTADRLTRLNQFVVEQLKPFNDAQTSTRLAFTHLSMNAARVVWAAMDIDLSKKGPKNEIEISVRDFEYFYPELPGATPTFKGTATGRTDILRFLSQSQLNVVAPVLDTVIAEFAKPFLSDFGNAITLNVKVTEVRKDPKGNVTGVSFDVNSSVDPSRLPRGVDPRTAIVARLQAKGRADVATGISVEFNGECNPKAKAFEPGQEGLKEIIEKILNRDPQAIAQISGYLKTLNDLAKRITG